MKKLSVIFLLLFTMGLFCGCGNDNEETVVIDENQVRTIVLEKVPNGEIQELTYDDDDDNPNYDVKISDGTTIYEYEVNAIDGTITEMDKEVIDNGTTTDSITIDETKAREIALNKTGTGEVTSVEYNGDDVVPNYEVVVSDGTYEYDYEISALDGSIINSEKEKINT